MSLLDFFKPKAKTLSPVVPVLSKNPECDINKTHLIAALFSVPKAGRDQHWRQEFYEHVATASFGCVHP